MTRTNEALWEKAKTEAKAKMGGKHSARAMQLAGKIYKDKGGSYTGPKTEAQKSLASPHQRQESVICLRKPLRH
jgi:hypothetical protein